MCLFQALIYLKKSYQRLKNTFQNITLNKRIELPQPKGSIVFDNVIFVPHGSNLPIIKGISFKVEAGQIVGIIGKSGSGKTTIARLLTNIFETNLFSYFWGAQAAASSLSKGGSIINISSLAAKRGTTNNSAYSATKFGVTALTQSLCKELGMQGIRVNAVCPVLIDTPGLLTALRNEQSPSGDDTREFLENFAASQTALGRLPTANEVAKLCLFLSSKEASGITGQSINVDCGVLPN